MSPLLLQAFKVCSSVAAADTHKRCCLSLLNSSEQVTLQQLCLYCWCSDDSRCSSAVGACQADCCLLFSIVTEEAHRQQVALCSLICMNGVAACLQCWAACGAGQGRWQPLHEGDRPPAQRRTLRRLWHRPHPFRNWGRKHKPPSRNCRSACSCAVCALVALWNLSGGWQLGWAGLSARPMCP